jgi:hypothetical protein
MNEVTRRTGCIDRVAAYFGIGPLDFRLTRADLRRLSFASAFPILVLICEAVLLFFAIVKNIPFDGTAGSVSDTWWRVYLFTSVIHGPFLPVSLALLFAFSIYPVSRSQGTGAIVIAVILLGTAICLGLISASSQLTFRRADQASLNIWYSRNWSAIAYDCGFLAIGYTFLAYRGLSRSAMPQPRPASDDQPREL